ncbi:MAG: DUF5337 family protein [Rhodobacteraceae bacterium]|nr:DUF5337 family protein [Paracoccaceae bacterium]
MITKGQGLTQRVTNHQHKPAMRARQVAFVIAGTFLVWMGAQYIGGKMGWDTRLVFLFDLAALAACLWALGMAYHSWCKRQG